MKTSSNRTLNRRQFLQHGLAASAGAYGFFVAGSAAAKKISANEKLNLAIVGVANKGWHNVEQLTSENIVALCDVDERFLLQAAQTYPQAKQFRDYRQLLDQLHQQIDAVVVSTADHTHAPATSAALDLGKHVYCEKPLTHTVQEARAIAQLAARRGVATQMGTQIHAGDNYRRVVELIRSGAVGTVREVYCWCNKGWSGGRFQAGDHPVPAHLDWDLWLGPASKHAYSPNIHPGDWRRFWEFGSGTFGDMACHVMDLPFWALELRYPSRVQCLGPEVHPVGAPEWVKASYEFPSDQGDPIQLHWTDGGAHFPRVEETKDRTGKPLSQWGLGVLFVGDQGMLAADYGRRELLPETKFQDFAAPAPTLPDSIGHWNEWVQACKTGSATSCNFDYSGALTETVLLGIVAFRAGQALDWNAAELKATNTDHAEPFVKKSYRQGFEVVGISNA